MHEAFAPVAARVCHRREDRNAINIGSGLLRVGACDDLGAIRAVAETVEAALRTGQPLVDDLGGFINKNAHALLANSTAAFAASNMVG